MPLPVAIHTKSHQPPFNSHLDILVFQNLSLKTNQITCPSPSINLMRSPLSPPKTPLMPTDHHPAVLSHLPGIEEITKGQAHANTRKLYRDISTGTAIFLNCTSVLSFPRGLFLSHLVTEMPPPQHDRIFLYFPFLYGFLICFWNSRFLLLLLLVGNSACLISKLLPAGVMSLEILTNLSASILVTCLSHSLLLFSIHSIGWILQHSLIYWVIILSIFVLPTISSF
jgi:hypothetical protein